MELPRRARGDELLQPGEMQRLRASLRRLSARHDLATVIAYAFDRRTRMLPFIYADLRMAPAGPRAIGAAMVDAGFDKTRIVLQQWKPGFNPGAMRLDGRVPDIFMLSSMQIHFARGRDLIRSACTIDPAHRPLIIVGGPKFIYEPWDAFSHDPRDRWAADVAVTGEEFVLLELLQALLEMRAAGEPLRSTFIRARNSGLLEGIPGLVYARTDADGVPQELVDTGVQRLLGDLDELPDPVLGYRLLEPPDSSAVLAARALPPDRIRRCTPIGSLALTFGCKFNCSYCPIPAYNQRQYRVKSGERIADEMRRLHREFGMRSFFGADDNFFNTKARTLEILEALARCQFDGRPIRKCIRWGTEVTVHDTLELKEHLPLARNAGIRALWLGVEDMTATLVKKGQSVGKTVEAFRLLQRHGINPMPMMIHHDSQPLYTRGRPYGLLNQVRLLRKSGAVSLQVLMMTPATGSKSYAEMYTSGAAFDRVGGRTVEEHMYGGCYVIASHARSPWRKQLNIIVAYLYFYNPLRLLVALVRPRSRLYLADAIFQALGMWGTVKTIRRTLGWAVRLCSGRIARRTQVPASPLAMTSADGGHASHAIPTGMVQLVVSAASRREASVTETA